MSDRISPERERSVLQDRVSTPTPRRAASPIILVPATPPAMAAQALQTVAGSNAVAAQTGFPRSYAQIAAIHATPANAIVRPQSTVPGVALVAPTQAAPTMATAGGNVVPPAALQAVGQLQMPRTPILRPTITGLSAIEGRFRLPPPAYTGQGVQALDTTATPRLLPVAVALDDVKDPFALPPQAFPGTGTQFLESNTSDSISSYPTSESISFTTTGSATPAPAAPTPSSIIPLSPSSGAGSTAIESYNDFWAQFDSPFTADANLPAALQTASILSTLSNDVIPPSQWPAPNQAASKAPQGRSENKENAPPHTISSDSHPPVASRFRKRRRGTSPPIGERAKKAAKRKAKGKEVDRSPAIAAGHTPFNPWASSLEAQTPREASILPPDTLVTSPLPPSSYASTNTTPYDDFARHASSTTSFYARMNASGSFPTPHALSSSPMPSTSFSAPPMHALRPLSPIEETSPVATSTPLASIALPSGQESQEARPTRAFPRVAPRLSSAASLLSRPGSADISMRYSPSVASQTSERARVNRRLRNILTDPSTTPSPDHAYQSPTVEDDDQEEGELEDSRRDGGFYNEAWGPRAQYVRRFPISDERSQRERAASRLRLYDDPREERGRSRTRHDSPMHEDNRLSDRETSQGPPQPTRDEIRARASPRRQMLDEDRHSPERRQRINSSFAHYDASRIAASAGRTTALDIFDIGDDENVPDAVRRGGAASTASEDCPTPIPQEGDPEVHQHDPEAHLNGMSDDWIQEVWADPTGTSITLSTFNPRFTRSYGTNRRTASDIRQAIASITHESDFLVIAPDQAQGHRGRGPYEWAVTGLTASSVELLLRRRVWSLKHITFFPRRRALETPRLLLALEGFLDDNVSNIYNAVRSTFERPQVRSRIEQMINANPEYNAIPPHEAFRRVMSSLRVTVYTLDNGTVVANVFLRAPTQSIRVWRLWVQELRNLTFGSYHTAIARARRITSCAGCAGVDHPSHLCPFTRMAGWNGPEEAGSFSYSIDGRELPARQASSTPLTRPPSSSQLRRPYQPSSSQRYPQAGPSGRFEQSASSSQRNQEHVRDDDRGRERGRGRRQAQSGQGSVRRSKQDSSRHATKGRDGSRRDGGR